jgi:hypothetical protein
VTVCYGKSGCVLTTWDRLELSWSAGFSGEMGQI